MPVPDIRVWLPTRSASLVPTIAFADVSPRTVSELPDDVTRRINLDDAVVELIGDEDVAWLVKSGTRDPASAQN
jgi:hypothetical protein